MTSGKAFEYIETLRQLASTDTANPSNIHLRLSLVLRTLCTTVGAWHTAIRFPQETLFGVAVLVEGPTCDISESLFIEPLSHVPWMTTRDATRAVVALDDVRTLRHNYAMSISTEVLATLAVFWPADFEVDSQTELYISAIVGLTVSCLLEFQRSVSQQTASKIRRAKGIGEFEVTRDLECYTESDDMAYLLANMHLSGGSLEQFLNNFSQEAQTKIYAALRDCAVNQKAAVLEVEGPSEGAFSRWLDLDIRPSGVVTHPKALCTATDISREKAVEKGLVDYSTALQHTVDKRTKDLSEALIKAQASEKAVSTFLANTSHEFRTPIHAILSFTKFALTTADAQTAQNLMNVKSSAEDLLSLVNNILDLSKLRAGKMAYAKEPVFVGGLVKDVVEKLKGLAHDKEVMLGFKTVGDAVESSADKLKLTQVIRNLLANALKFSPAKTVIRTTVDYEMYPGEIVITVEDQGPGVPPGELESIFSPFMQSTSNSTKGGGTGLGLSISREIIEAGHSGKLFAENLPDRGAKFTARLPALT